MVMSLPMHTGAGGRRQKFGKGKHDVLLGGIAGIEEMVGNEALGLHMVQNGKCIRYAQLAKTG
jgi:hypothetical protein